MIAVRSVIDRIVKVGGHAILTSRKGCGELLIDVVRTGIELTHVVSVDEINVPVLACPYREVPDYAAGVDHIRQDQRPARAEVLVGIRLGNGIEHVEIVRHRQRATDGEFHERVSVVSVDWKALCVECRVGRPIGSEEIDVAGIGSHTCAALPDGALTPVRSDVQHLRLEQQVAFVVTDNPRSIGIDIAVRRPGGVNKAVQQKEGGAFLVLLWIKSKRRTVPFGACARIRRLDFYGPAELFGPGSNIQRVQALMVSTGGIFAHCDYVNRAMGPPERSMTGVAVTPISGVTWEQLRLSDGV